VFFRKLFSRALIQSKKLAAGRAPVFTKTDSLGGDVLCYI
jgi:hypothetical protein